MRFPTIDRIITPENDIYGDVGRSTHIVNQYLYQMESPNVFGVYGDWGSGKTTLMRFMKDTIKEDGHKIVWFETWKYERTSGNEVVFALIDQVMKQTKYRSLDKLKKRLYVLFRAVTIGTTDILFEGLASKARENLGDSETALYTPYEQWTDDVGAFSKEYTSILNQARKGKQIYIFIDDLDRCLPENVINLFEVIKHFLAVEGVIFILALNRPVIEQYLNTRYKDLDTNIGSEYVDKIIPYWIDIPKKDDQALIHQYFQKYPESIKTHIPLWSDFLSQFTNIRKKKHVLIRFLCTQDIEKESEEDVVFYLIWLALREFCPGQVSLDEKKTKRSFEEGIVFGKEKVVSPWYEGRDEPSFSRPFIKGYNVGQDYHSKTRSIVQKMVCLEKKICR